MQLTGLSFIGNRRTASAGKPIYGINPTTGEKLEPAYYGASTAALDQAVELAAEAFPSYSTLPGTERAKFLRRIAGGLDDIQQAIAERAHLETALPLPRLTGEVARTTGQLRLFATLLEEGSWVDARIDTPLPDRKPLPRPGLRSMLRPLGPVAVFGASNFPIAFSAAGGDTASALAAGCPVVVKAHSAHPGTNELVAAVIQSAVADCGLHEGVYSLLFGSGAEIGSALVRHPLIKAVGFTGSLRGGRQLMDLAASRPEPIPCFTEMSAINPVFLRPGTLHSAPETTAQNLFNSFTLGAGQFCTRPGVVFYVNQPEAQTFLARLEELVSAAAPFTLLTPGIAASYTEGTTQRAQSAHTTAATAAASANGCSATAQLYQVELADFLAKPDLAEEIFGPTTLLVRCASASDLLRAATAMQGQLTATILGTGDELAQYKPLLAMLEQKAGRVIFNGFPTGVEVSHAMVHGGPYPATADARFTSVGTQAIYRFVRPVCFQSFPDTAMPPELQATNPLNIARLVDGTLTRDPLPTTKPTTPTKRKKGESPSSPPLSYTCILNSQPAPGSHPTKTFQLLTKPGTCHSEQSEEPASKGCTPGHENGCPGSVFSDPGKHKPASKHELTTDNYELRTTNCPAPTSFPAPQKYQSP
jgi:2,5-dioxopentanoate dehydrogenase